MYLWDFHLMCDHALLDFSLSDWWEAKLFLAFCGLRKRFFGISIFLLLCNLPYTFVDEHSVNCSMVSACWSRELSYWDSLFHSHASQVTAELSSNFCFLNKALWTVSRWGLPSCSVGGKQSLHSKHFKCRMQPLSRDHNVGFLLFICFCVLCMFLEEKTENLKTTVMFLVVNQAFMAVLSLQLYSVILNAWLLHVWK